MRPLTDEDVLGPGVLLGREGEIIVELRERLFREHVKLKIALEGEEFQSAPTEEQRKWIAVSERVPDHQRSVLIAMSDGRVDKTAYYRGEFIMPSKAQPTHWMPLPDAPVSPQREKP